VNDPPVNVSLFGDSIFAGYGLPRESQLALLLQRRLYARGINITVEADGVPDETAQDGLRRLSTITADLVLVEFGLNDAIRGVPAAETSRALVAIIGNLQTRGKRVILVEAKVPPQSRWPSITSPGVMVAALAKRHGTGFCPDILSAFKTDFRLLQKDGLHPNEDGAEIVADLLLHTILKDCLWLHDG
jgi:acyl-CoA thioesterase I